MLWGVDLTLRALRMELGAALSPNLHRNGVIFHAASPSKVDGHEKQGILWRSQIQSREELQKRRKHPRLREPRARGHFTEFTLAA